MGEITKISTANHEECYFKTRSSNSRRSFWFGLHQKFFISNAVFVKWKTAVYFLCTSKSGIFHISNDENTGKEGDVDTKNSQDIMSKKFLNASDICELMQVSRSTAYRIMKTLNDELDKKGKITVAGRIPAKYFFERVYM